MVSSPVAKTVVPADARPQSRCIACGPDHPHGLRLKFHAGPDGVAEAEWTPTADWEGFEGIIHGGVVSTVLDEAMAKAVVARHSHALTGELRVRFHTHVEPGARYIIRGWVAEQKKRLLKTEAALLAAGGGECAHAWAMFVELPRRRGDAAVSDGMTARLPGRESSAGRQPRTEPDVPSNSI